MPFKFLVVPQWQGSGSARALLLQDGAEAIQQDLPVSATTKLPVPVGAGETLGTGIRRFSAINAIREQLLAQIDSEETALITIGGDCGVELGAVEHAVHRSSNPIALVWFDAHPDLNSVLSSPSGAFAGMVLRALTDPAFGPLGTDDRSRPLNSIVVGARDIDEGESAFLEESKMPWFSADFDSVTLIEAIQSTGSESVYIHIDLDVIDPGEFTSVSSPIPFGVSIQKLIETIRAILARFPLAGAGICGFAPPNPQHAQEDLPTILRIIAALTSSPKVAT
ncbi:MAG: arginase family protein [Microbacteriaceae bacterium]|nr:arginase family protein [Microbacteriaceae bacterium]